MSSSPASDLLGADVVRELEPPKGGLAVVPDLPHAGFYAVAWPGPQAGWPRQRNPRQTLKTRFRPPEKPPKP